MPLDLLSRMNDIPVRGSMFMAFQLAFSLDWTSATRGTTAPSSSMKSGLAGMEACSTRSASPIGSGWERIISMLLERSPT